MATYRENDNSWCFTIRVPDDMYQAIEMQPGCNTSAKVKQLIAKSLASQKLPKNCLGVFPKQFFGCLFRPNSLVLKVDCYSEPAKDAVESNKQFVKGTFQAYIEDVIAA